MTMSHKLISLRLGLAAAALTSALGTVAATRATAQSGPTCPGLGCNGGYTICATLTYSDGTRVNCLTHS